jgi:hypothetical protein
VVNEVDGKKDKISDIRYKTNFNKLIFIGLILFIPSYFLALGKLSSQCPHTQPNQGLKIRAIDYID